MTVDPKAVGLMLQALRSPVLAITTRQGERDNGLIALSGAPGSVIDEAMRIMVGLSKPNLTHDMIMESKIFAVHLLPAGPDDDLARALDIVKELGGHSGRAHDKFKHIPITRGQTGAPILKDSLLYVECNVVKAFDGDENTIFLGDVVAAVRLRKGVPLDAVRLWTELPEDWKADYERAHNAGLVAQARRLRGLA